MPYGSCKKVSMFFIILQVLMYTAYEMVFSLLEFCKRTARSRGMKKNGNCKRKSRAQKLANCTLRDLATKPDVHGRHCMLSYLSSLPISVLRSLDTEANKF